MNYIKIFASFILLLSISINSVDAKKKQPKKKKTTAVQKKGIHSRINSRSSKTSSRVKPLIRPATEDMNNETEAYQEAVKTGSSRINPADTIDTKTVVITSAFKPSLKTAAKINFYAATPIIDTNKIPLTYQVPSQNLFFSYQPVPLKPLALNQDSLLRWENHAYVKAGFGNYTTPLIEAAASFGNPNSKAYQVNLNHLSSKGDETYQQFSRTSIAASGTFAIPNNTEVTSKVYWDNNSQYKYGFNKLYSFNEDQLKQTFNTFGIDAALHNKAPNKYNIIYSPEIKFNYFYDNNHGSEVNGLAKASLQKVNDLMTINVGLTADITSFSSSKYATKSTINNGLYYFDPYIIVKATDMNFKLGITPTWDNQSFYFLPNFTADYRMKDKKTLLQAGYVGYGIKNSYHTLAQTNPFIDQPKSLDNTIVKEFYLGFKSNYGKHLNFSGKIAIKEWLNMPLFISDSTANNVQTYFPVFEPELHAIQFHGEVSYQLQEKLSILGAFTYNHYTSQNTYAQPFGLTPLEITTTARYYVTKDIMLKGDLFLFDGTHFMQIGGTPGTTKGGMDLNLGVQFNLMPKLDLFMQFNNIFNANYQKWNRYDVLGFNVLGGVVYSFR